ncbi:MAG: threonine synthase [Canibacter sp.]
MSDAPHYVDPVTGEQYSLNDLRWKSDAGNPLIVADLPGISRANIEYATRGIWRFKKAFAAKHTQMVSLGEGNTPLVDTPWLSSGARCKVEWTNPTGSFKDRGASVMVSMLKTQGLSSILEDSSGNGGSAIAAYGAAAGIDVTVFAPESTSDGKLTQAAAYGATIVKVPGPRHASQSAAIHAHEIGRGFYASHNWHPMFLEGTKTLAYEIWEDLGYEAPDNVVVPVGAGSTLLGCAIGFAELKRAGQITQEPKLYAAQPLNCSPIDAAFRGEQTRQIQPTVAEGTAIAQPLRLKQILAALRDTDGGTIAVTETEIREAHARTARHGLYAEPTSAVAVAGYQKLLSTSEVSAEDTSVVVLTGSGLKSPTSSSTQIHQ